MASGVVVGIWPFPIIPQIEALLKPAADRGHCAIERGPGWHLWTVHMHGELVGAANVRRCTDASVDVVLVGGRNAKEWIGPLDSRLGEWAVAEGATRMTARGRRGWARVLIKQGWTAMTDDHVTEYERLI